MAAPYVRLERAREGRGYHESFVHGQWFPPTQGSSRGGSRPRRDGGALAVKIFRFESCALEGSSDRDRASGAAESGRAAFAAASAVSGRPGTRETGRGAR